MPKILYMDHNFNYAYDYEYTPNLDITYSDERLSDVENVNALKDYVCRYEPIKNKWKQVEENFGQDIILNLVEHDKAPTGGTAVWKAKIIDNIELGIVETIGLVDPQIYIHKDIDFYRQVEYCIFELCNLEHSNIYNHLRVQNDNGILTDDEAVMFTENLEHERIIPIVHNFIRGGVNDGSYDQALYDSTFN